MGIEESESKHRTRTPSDGRCAMGENGVRSSQTQCFMACDLSRLMHTRAWHEDAVPLSLMHMCALVAVPLISMGLPLSLGLGLGLGLGLALRLGFGFGFGFGFRVRSALWCSGTLRSA